MDLIKGITIGVVSTLAVATIGLATLDSKSLNYKSMVIKQADLSRLNAMPEFNSLYFNQRYDNTFILRDGCSLYASAWTVNLERQIDLDENFMIPGDDKTKLEGNLFSDYEFSKIRIAQLLEIVPTADYFIFTPEYYPANDPQDRQQYIRFIITAYDVNRTMLPIDNDLVRQVNPCPPARPY
ncbi:MAG: hypothetical protein ABIO04_03285 [Ferruginibacter sp.]